MSYEIGLNICAITAGNKKNISRKKSIIKKKMKKHNKIVLLGKEKLDTIKVFILTALINSYIIHDDFFSVKYLLRE